MKNSIAIIGFMGSGKTTIGRLMAERFGYLFIDLDNIIEISEKKTINDIFEHNGEKYFRDTETNVIRKIAYNKRCVFACGGGIILRKENMRLITLNCDVVFLMISRGEAIKRLSVSTGRPLIPKMDRDKEILGIFKRRANLYKQYAEIIINNDNIASEKAVDLITERLKGRNSD